MSITSPPVIRKASGEQVPFDIGELVASLKRSGANEEVAKHIADSVVPQLTPGISTRKLYPMAFGTLRKRS